MMKFSVILLGDTQTQWWKVKWPIKDMSILPPTWLEMKQRKTNPASNGATDEGKIINISLLGDTTHH